MSAWDCWQQWRVKCGTHARRRESAGFGIRRICRVAHEGEGNFHSVAQIVDVFQLWSYQIVCLTFHTTMSHAVRLFVCEGLADCGSCCHCFFR